MYTTKITSQGTVSIPASLRKKYGLRTGDVLTVEDTGKIELAPIPSFAELRKLNAPYIKNAKKNKGTDVWEQHVLEKYGKGK